MSDLGGPEGDPSPPGSRAQVLAALADRIAAVRCDHPVRVAIDGIDTAGKTTLAVELVAPLQARGRPVIRASLDGFHRPRAERYRRGPDSPEGYYLDSFDCDAVRRALLIPLGPDGDRRYRRRVFDFRADAPLDPPPEIAPPDAVLLFDGVFLLRPELADGWDLRIFVAIRFDEMLRRAVARDAALFGSAAAAEARYRQRYLPGQRLYLASVHPQEQADLVVYNDDPARPVLVVGPR